MLCVGLPQREAASKAQGELRAVQHELEQERAGNAARVEGLKAALEAQEARSAALDQELRTRPTSQMVTSDLEPSSNIKHVTAAEFGIG